MSEHDLAILEEKASRIIEIAQQLRTENKQLEDENTLLKTEVGKLQSENKQIVEKISNKNLKSELQLIQPEKIKELKSKIQGVLSRLDSD